MDVLKVGILGLVGVLLALQFKTVRQEYGLYIGFGVGLLIFSYVVHALAVAAERLEGLRAYIDGAGPYFPLLLKVVGITYVCEFCSGICKDAGYASVAGQIEIFGKLSVLLSGMPILLAIIEDIRGIGG